MKKIYQLLQITLLIFANHLPAFPQLPQSPASALSPNAAGLGLYGSIPVSYYTGVPEISIPLYNLSSYNFQLPISLSYHASGVRPDQHPGWVGLGWSLNAGGLITRTINALPDEANDRNYNSKKGFYYKYSVLNNPSWNQLSYLRQVAQSQQDDIYGPQDTAPDEFSFNFAGYSGKFYLTHTGTWAVQCDKPVKVVFNDTFLDIPIKREPDEVRSPFPPSFSGFTIITEDGTEYIFGGDTSSIEYSVDFFLQTMYTWVATSWYLKKIILPNKQEVNFTYERGDFINQMYISVHQNLGYSTETKKDFFSIYMGCSYSSFSTDLQRFYQGSLIAPVYLKEVKANNTIITFDRSQSTELRYSQNIYDWKNTEWPYPTPIFLFLRSKDGYSYSYPGCLDNLKWYKLDKITVKNVSNSVIKTINFTYNNLSTQRLMLMTVGEQWKKPYKFEYDNAQNLPPYLANKTDHWGFYNGTYAYLDDMGYYYSYRNPNEAYLKYGIMNQMTYPTGGYTVFEFEPHQYRKQLKLERWKGYDELPTNNLAGGLRIKQIKDYSSTGSLASLREFFYVSDYLQNKTNASKSSGVLGGQFQYSFNNYTVYSFNNNNLRVRMNVFSSNSVLPSCSNINGSHIGYTEVIEKREDNAFSRYQFTNFDNGYLDERADTIIQESRTPYEHYASKEQERGKLKLMEEYNSNGSKVRSKLIDYEKDNATSSNYVRAMNASVFSICKTGSAYDEGIVYKIYTYKFRPSSETETFYHPSTGASLQTSTTNYVYNDKKLIKSVSKVNSNGETFTTNFRYPSDFSTTYPYNEMVSKNILSPVVEKSEYKNSTMLLKTEINSYDKFHSTFYAPISLQIKNGAEQSETRMVYAYDSKANLKEAVKDNVEKVVYLWAYNYQYPVAEIKNASYSQVTAIIPEATLNTIATKNEPSTADWNTINALRTSMSQAAVTTYTYTPLVGMKTMIDPREIKTTYYYDSLGRLFFIADNQGKTIQLHNYHYQNQ